MSWPSTVTVPDVGVTIPQTMLISVVLPAPFGPRSAKISPRRIERFTFFSASKPDAYRFERPRISMIGVVDMLGLVPAVAACDRGPPVLESGAASQIGRAAGRERMQREGR